MNCTSSDGFQCLFLWFMNQLFICFWSSPVDSASANFSASCPHRYPKKKMQIFSFGFSEAFLQTGCVRERAVLCLPMGMAICCAIPTIGAALVWRLWGASLSSFSLTALALSCLDSRCTSSVGGSLALAPPREGRFDPLPPSPIHPRCLARPPMNPFLPTSHL